MKFPILLYDEVQTGQYRGSDEQPHPEDDVPEDDAAFEQFTAADHDEGHLQELHPEEIAADFLEEDGHAHFVDEGAEQEGDEGGGGAAEAKGGDAAVVDVAEEEVVHGTVPVARVLVPGDRVPPVAVKAAVGEAGELREHVEDALPDQVPREQLLEEQGEEDVGHDEGELAPPRLHREPGVLHRDRLGYRWVDEGLRDHHHDAQNAERRRGFLQHVPPVDVGLAWVLELVHQRRQADVLGQVKEGKVVRVGLLGRRGFTLEFLRQVRHVVFDDGGERLHLVVGDRFVGLDGRCDARNVGAFDGEIGARARAQRGTAFGGGRSGTVDGEINAGRHLLIGWAGWGCGRWLHGLELLHFSLQQDPTTIDA
nr:hypothetical protein CFP56_48838 [Quercus suber]